MTPGSIWWHLQRNAKRGFAASWHAYRTLPEIFRWQCPDYGTDPSDVIIHSLAGEEQAPLFAWMLASFHHVTRRNWSVVLHDDGTLTPATAEALVNIFDTRLNILSREDADQEMAGVLVQHLHCQQYRVRHPLALKIFDIPVLTPAKRFLLIDCDVLFFRRPNILLNWVDSGKSDCWFNQDVNEASLMSSHEAKEIFNVTLWPKVNSGLCCIATEAIDLDFCDDVMRKTQIASGNLWRLEQTLFALCASRYGKGGLLPQHYEVSLGKFAAEGCIARHYVGAVRDRFYAEGLANLKGMLGKS